MVINALVKNTIVKDARRGFCPIFTDSPIFSALISEAEHLVITVLNETKVVDGVGARGRVRHPEGARTSPLEMLARDTSITRIESD